MVRMVMPFPLGTEPLLSYITCPISRMVPLVETADGVATFVPFVGGVTPRLVASPPVPTIERSAVEDGAGSGTAQLIANRFRLAVW